MRYEFYDTDPTGREEYDISGEDYLQLMKTCFRYSNSVALLVDRNKTEILMLLKPIAEFEIPVIESVGKLYTQYGVSPNTTCIADSHYEVRHYILSPQVQETLLSVTDSIFKWICGWGYANPSDPAFFRANGSIFFCSVIHDGVCILMPNEDEDVTNIISKGYWKTSDEQGEREP